MAKLKMNFSQNPDVYIKKQARIRNQRPRIYKVHNHLFLNFFKVENLLHCDGSGVRAFRSSRKICDFFHKTAYSTLKSYRKPYANIKCVSVNVHDKIIMCIHIFGKFCISCL